MSVKHPAAALRRLAPQRYFLAILVASLAVACQPANQVASSSKTLTIGASIPKTADPGAGINFIVNAFTREAFLAIGRDGRPEPRVIDSWSRRENNLGVRLHVPSGIRFHDGTLLTNAIAANILRDAMINGGSVLNSSIVSIEPLGFDQIEIETKEPEGFLLSDLSAVDLVHPIGSHVGTGPFRYESAGPPILLRAFDQYRTGRPALDTVKITPHETPRMAWAAMMRGENNMLFSVSHEAVDFVEAESAVQTYPFERGYYDALIFNQRHPVLRNRAVRQAISEAVDRQQIIDVALHQHGTIAKGPLWPYHWALPSAFPYYDFNPRSAGHRLDDTGFAVRPSADPERMPSRFRFNCLVVAEDERLQRIALVLQKQLYKLDIDLDVQLVPVRDMRERMAAGTFDSLLAETVSSRSSAYVYMTWRSPAPGASGFINSGYTAADAPLDRFKHAIEDDDVRGAMAAVQQAIFDDPPAVFIDWTDRTRAVSREIVVPSERGRDILATVQQWRPAPSSTQQARR
jgi:peptide/nickel transport system substrate-binding protein